MAATGKAEWKGDLKGGAGTFAAGDGSIAGDFSFRTRFEDAPGATNITQRNTATMAPAPAIARAAASDCSSSLRTMA